MPLEEELSKTVTRCAVLEERIVSLREGITVCAGRGADCG